MCIRDRHVPVGEEIGMDIYPEDIHIMKKSEEN